MKHRSVRMGMLATAVWNALAGSTPAHGKEQMQSFSLYLGHGLHIGAESHYAMSSESNSGSLLFASGTIGWSTTLGGVHVDVGALYGSAGDLTDGVINAHTQFTKTVAASERHSLVLSMRLNAAIPVMETENSTMQVTAALRDTLNISEAFSLSQHLTLTAAGETLQWGSYDMHFAWKPTDSITFALPVHVGVPLSSEGEPDVQVKASFKIQF